MADKKPKRIRGGYDTGLYQTPIYRAWFNMKTRCTNPKFIEYERYGGRGISFCEKWDHFKGFLEDMGETYMPGFSLDRIDNDGNYSKENCRWANRITQSNNRRSNTFFEIGGVRRTMAEWIRLSSVKSSTVRQRFYGLKWPIEKALFTVKNKKSA